MFIPGEFKSNDFVSARGKGFADAFLVCAHSKEVASADVRASTVWESVGSAKPLAGFALHVTSVVIDVNGKLIVGGENAHSKAISETVRAVKKRAGCMWQKLHEGRVGEQCGSTAPAGGLQLWPVVRRSGLIDYPVGSLCLLLLGVTCFFLFGTYCPNCRASGRCQESS